MRPNVHNRIKVLIEETNDAFSSEGAVNADYAEYATLALGEFKHVLSNPGLTRRQLMNILRAGMTRHRQTTPGSCWSTFMAQYVARTANRNAVLNVAMRD